MEFLDSYLLLHGHGDVGLDLVQSLHQELGLVRGLHYFLWLVDAEMMLLAQLKETPINVHCQKIIKG